MANKTCSVCALPDDVRSHGERLIVQGREYREIASLRLNGPSKSSWHRHMNGCFRRREFYGLSKPSKSRFGRVLISYEGDVCFYWNGKPAASQDGDVEMVVVYDKSEPVRGVSG